MRIYRISATKGNISFTQSIKADSYVHARAKFNIENNKYTSFSYLYPEDKVFIDKITRRY